MRTFGLEVKGLPWVIAASGPAGAVATVRAGPFRLATPIEAQSSVSPRD